jgi:hypothetical protein
MAFFHYSQNNSGGSWSGPTDVIVEAPNASAADSIAEYRAGVYFDGSYDCSCCGNRWSEAYGEGDPEPNIFGVVLTLDKTEDDLIKEAFSSIASYWHEKEILLVLADGTTKTWKFGTKEVKKAEKLKKAVTPSVFGFAISTAWVGDVSQFWRSDYDKTKYWDKEGNHEVIVGPKGLGWLQTKDYNYTWVYFTSETIEEAHIVHDEVMRLRNMIDADVINALADSLDRLDKEKTSLSKANYKMVRNQTEARWLK